jgi:hypothetical protein
MAIFVGKKSTRGREGRGVREGAKPRKMSFVF